VIEYTSKIKGWTEGVEVDENALEQLENTSSLPIIFSHIAVMPDVHWGIGSTVGSVVATRGAVIPAAVGVDLGCGMIAQKTSLKVDDMKNLSRLRVAIESAVPHGRTDNGQRNDRGAWGYVPKNVASTVDAYFKYPIASLVDKYPKIAKNGNWTDLVDRAARQFGTLGTGNHFIEICKDEEDYVWIMLHSGSRGLGNILASYFITEAKDQAARFSYETYLPDKDLAWLSEGTPIFGGYIEAVNIAQQYAAESRIYMMDRVKHTLHQEGYQFYTLDAAVNCHHNYLEKEHHFGKDVWITRKGAVRARTTDLGIIPGSMGAKSFIVQGKGNVESFQSCSHGAGRRLGRNAAKKSISLAEFNIAMGNIESRRDAAVLDEAPQAYKNIDAVMEAQKDLVEVKHTLNQLIVVKG
jgi:tRNA-splicing ligase RtcB